MTDHQTDYTLKLVDLIIEQKREIALLMRVLKAVRAVEDKIWYTQEVEAAVQACKDL